MKNGYVYRWEDLIYLECLFSLNWSRDQDNTKVPAGCICAEGRRHHGKLILKFIWKYKEPRMTKTVFLKTKFGDLIVHDFKTYYKAIEIKSVWYWHKFRQTGQWQRSKSRPTLCWYLIFNKARQLNAKVTAFWQIMVEQLNICMKIERNLNFYLAP